ncbi:hypothetical protein WJX72_003120 [[Myrmecia] bisecta]|uniref:Uncharacterized protein n=1 Tax=[Myrmecia] bisecta TaxID=41462 RepID=A0AAW1R5X0_9CHLO
MEGMASLLQAVCDLCIQRGVAGHHAAKILEAGSLLDATMLLEPHVVRACGQFLVNGELRKQHKAQTAPDMYGAGANSKFA